MCLFVYASVSVFMSILVSAMICADACACREPVYSQAKKGASLAHGLGVSENIKKVTGDQRDDWDVFHPKAMSRQADSNKHVDKVRVHALAST